MSISAVRGAVFEGLKRQEEIFAMYDRFSKEATDKILSDFFRSLADDVKGHIDMMKHLNLHSIVKFGLPIKFNIKSFHFDQEKLHHIKDKANAKELLKLGIDEVNADIEYYEHIANHALFPEVKRIFRVLADKELDHKSKMKVLYDVLE
ncbi:MAG: ferritin family protein [Candidatus Woesearchaeota archaeon]